MGRLAGSRLLGHLRWMAACCVLRLDGAISPRPQVHTRAEPWFGIAAAPDATSIHAHDKRSDSCTQGQAQAPGWQAVFAAGGWGRCARPRRRPVVTSAGGQQLTILHLNDVYNIDARPEEPVGGAARMAHAMKQFSREQPLVLFRWGVGGGGPDCRGWAVAGLGRDEFHCGEGAAAAIPRGCCALVLPDLPWPWLAPATSTPSPSCPPHPTPPRPTAAATASTPPS